ncbi:MAG: DUF3352 domain-containing protein [Desulfobacteraceae bacterium]|nr:DUF3352 domain-containing protein [Desulfobacteraceae bacterium]
MKKILISFFIIAVAAGAGAYFYLAKAPVLLSSAPEELLPKDTAAFVQIKNIEKNIDKMAKTKLGKNFEKIDFISTAQKLELSEETIEKLKSIKKNVTSEVNKKFFYNFFGKNFSIALVSLDYKTGENKPFNPEMIDAALLIEPKTNAKFSQIISESIPEIEKKEDYNYNNFTISKAGYKDICDFYHFIKNEYIVITLNLETAKKIADIKKDETSLASTKKFVDLKNKINSEKRDFFFYSNTDKIYSKIEELSKKPDFFYLENFRQKLNKDLKSLILCGFDKSDSIYESISDAELTYENTIPKENAKKFLAMIPEDIVSFSWQNNFDLEKIIKDYFNDDEKRKEFEDKLLMESGIDNQLFYNGFKGELGLIFADTDTQGMFPVPSLAFVFDKNAGTVFDRYFDFLQKKQNNSIPVQEKTINNTNIKTVPLPLGKAIEPSWGYFNDYFILAMNSDIFSQIITASNSEKSIENNKNFKLIKKELPEKFHMISFLNTVKLMDNIKSSGESLIRLAAFKAPDLTDKGNIVLNEVIFPLCDGLSVYEAFGNANVFDKNKFHGKSITKKSE